MRNRKFEFISGFFAAGMELSSYFNVIGARQGPEAAGRFGLSRGALSAGVMAVTKRSKKFHIEKKAAGTFLDPDAFASRLRRSHVRGIFMPMRADSARAAWLA
jgi:hypothetical protein